MSAQQILSEIGAFVCCNPFEADEFVWITNNPARAEIMLIDRVARYKVDKYVYEVVQTQELSELFVKLTNEEFKAVSFKKLKQFEYRNCGVPRVTLIAAIRR